MRRIEGWIVTESPDGSFRLGWLERGRVEVLALESRRFSYRENAETEALRRNRQQIGRTLHPVLAY